MVHFNGKGILLIRNPFKAILSAFRHIHFGAHSDSEIKTRINVLGALQSKQDKNKKINVEHFEMYALSHIKLWREIIEHWITLGEVLVVHFEDVVDDKRRPLKPSLEAAEEEGMRARVLERGPSELSQDGLPRDSLRIRERSDDHLSLLLSGVDVAEGGVVHPAQNVWSETASVVIQSCPDANLGLSEAV